MVDDARTGFYGEFLRHAVQASLQAVDEARIDTCGNGMSQQSRQRVEAILLDSLSQLQSKRAISQLDASTAQRVYDEIAMGIGSADQQEALHLECRRAVLSAFVNFAESLAAFVGEIAKERSN
jgi:hypothetical protein